MHPIGRAIVALYPLPNRTVLFTDYVSSPVGTDRRDQFDLRVDHATSDRSTATVRYSFADRNLYQPFSGSRHLQRCPASGRRSRRAQNLMAGERRSVGATLFNELRFNTRASPPDPSTRTWGRASSHHRAPGAVGRQARLGPELHHHLGYSPLGDEDNNPQHGTTTQVQIIDS